MAKPSISSSPWPVAVSFIGQDIASSCCASSHPVRFSLAICVNILVMGACIEPNWATSTAMYTTSTQYCSNL
jgi:hypothetical protein